METLRSWMIVANLWIPRAKRLKRPFQPRYYRDCDGELIQIDAPTMTGSKHVPLNVVCWCILMMPQGNCSTYTSVNQNQP